VSTNERPVLSLTPTPIPSTDNITSHNCKHDWHFLESFFSLEVSCIHPESFRASQVELTVSRKVDGRLPGKGNSNSHGARPVHLIITMIKWIRTSRLSIKNSLSDGEHDVLARDGCGPLLQGLQFTFRCRANMAHIRQPRPDSGLGFQVKVIRTFQIGPSLLGSGLLHPNPEPPPEQADDPLCLSVFLSLAHTLSLSLSLSLSLPLSKMT